MALSDVIQSIADQCDEEVKAASAAIGGKDQATEDQIANIVERVCTNRDHETDAAVRAEVRVTMKSKGYVWKAEKAAK